MDNQNILNALNDSHLVTVGGLNKVYRYVMSRIKISGASGSAVYKVQGSQYWDTLIKLDFLLGKEEAKDGVIGGRIYNVLDKDPEGITGANYVCLRQYRYNSDTQYYEVITYVLSSDTEYDPEKIYYIEEGENDFKVVPNPQPTDNPHDKGWYEQTWTNQIETDPGTFIQLTTSNIKEHWSIFWDSFGGSQPKADKEGQLGIVTIGDNIDISDAGKISVPPASDTVPGVLKVGGNLNYADNTVNIDSTNPISVSSGTIGLNYDSNTLELDNNKLKVKTSTGTNLGIVKSGDSINIDSSTGAVSVKIDGATIQRDTTTKNLYVRKANGTDLGVVSVGNNIDVSSDGQISVPYANQDNKKGVVTTGNNIVNNSGEISVRYANDDNEAGVVKIGTGLKYSNHEVSLGSTDPINITDGTISLKYDGTLNKNSNNELYVVQATSSGTGIVKAGDSISIDDTTAAVSVKIDGATIQRDSTTKNLYVRTANGDTTGVVKKGTNTSIDSDGKVNVTKLINNDTANTDTIINVANDSTKPVIKITGKKTTDGTTEPGDNSALYVDGDIKSIGYIRGEKVFHAIWNDVSDAIEVQDSLEIEAGCCYRFDGTEYSKTSEYCQKGIIGIHSDTAGSMLGKKGIHKELDISVGGFVLAYVDRQYESGTPLTSGPNGTLTEMKREDVREYPERLVATYWKPETETEWGSDMYKVTVNGRHWVKIK